MGRGRGRVTPTGIHIWPLTEGAAPLELVGGKGQALTRLAAAGLPIPAGFVVTTSAYRRSQPQVTAEVAGAITAAYRRLGSPPVAVRSSATAEDLPDASFAGQQETFLNVVGEQAVLDAVRDCWASLHSPRALAYRARLGLDETGVAMAVVVQELVDATAAGVAFTVDPVTGDDSAVLVNAAWGLGEAVVNGRVSADEFRVDDTGAVTAEIHDKQLMIVPTDAGTAYVPVPEDQRRRPSLSDRQAAAVAALARQIADAWDQPTDLEWCRRGEEILVLQARPITTSAALDLWNDSRAGDFLWSNTNVGEAIPDVMTPATWSMVQVFASRAMATASVPPYLGYGRIGGRIYLNVSVMQTLSAAVGVSERPFRQLTEEVFGRIPEGVEIPRVRANPVAVARGVLPMGLHVLTEARRDIRVLGGYLADHPRLCRQRHADIAATATPAGLAALWKDRLEPEFDRVSWMLSAATRSSGAAFVLTRQRLQRLVGVGGANALTAGLGSTAGQLASLGLLTGLDDLAAGRIDRDTFAWAYGHRGPHEFELSTPRPGEDPDWVDRELARRRADPVPIGDLLTRQADQRRTAWAELVEQHPVQARVLRRPLRRWAAIARDREQARGELVRYLWVLRAYALRAGALTSLGDDVFFCEGPEIVRVLRGETLAPRLLARRRRAYAAYSALPPYPTLIRGRFDPFAWAADSERRSDLFDPTGTTAAADTVRGFPGSAGVVTGRVRVLTDPADAAALQPGEVLVTTVTNVGWTPLFPTAAAVVTDVGAPLSHAAIVAREIGIPAVVGCGNATMRLRTGDRVRVDGTAGTVDRLEEPP